LRYCFDDSLRYIVVRGRRRYIVVRGRRRYIVVRGRRREREKNY
jgi:hypothetical protein